MIKAHAHIGDAKYATHVEMSEKRFCMRFESV